MGVPPPPGVMGSWRRSLFLHIWTKLKEVGAAAFKMVVGLLCPQLSRFFHTVTAFDSPALSNNCHKRLIIHYRFFVLFFFFVQKIKSVTDVNSRLGSMCLWLTASPKFIGSFFFFLFSLPIDFISFFFFFVHCVSLSLGFMLAFSLPADVRWGSVVTHSFAWQPNPNGRLRGG